MNCKECHKFSNDWYFCSERCEIKYKSERDENYQNIESTELNDQKCKHGLLIIENYSCTKCVYEVFGKFPNDKKPDLISTITRKCKA